MINIVEDLSNQYSILKYQCDIFKEHMIQLMIEYIQGIEPQYVEKIFQ